MNKNYSGVKIKKILVSQPLPENNRSPFFELAKKNNLTIDFRPFIQVEGVDLKEFRRQKINILDHTAVIFTSRTGVDHFFRISKELKLNIPETMKYFCINEATAFYLQKYIVYRKRKIFYGNGKFDDLIEVLMKHKDENFLVPLSDIHKQEIPRKLKKCKFKFTKAIFYKTCGKGPSARAEDTPPFGAGAKKFRQSYGSPIHWLRLPSPPRHQRIWKIDCSTQHLPLTKRGGGRYNRPSGGIVLAAISFDHNPPMARGLHERDISVRGSEPRAVPAGAVCTAPAAEHQRAEPGRNRVRAPAQAADGGHRHPGPDPPHGRSSRRLRGTESRRGQADGPDLRALRRPAGGSPRPVAVSALRAHHPRRPPLRQRHGRQQRAALRPPQGRGGDPEGPDGARR